MNTNRKLLTALAVGAAIGGILGVLYAPDKGVETRKKISDRTKKITDAAKEKLEQLRHHGNGAKDRKSEFA
ncbi:YtxH domain-containing protein [Ferruginibacter lapsinanis]|uniref:YtxH domain-containing protein n=1 Tax=Ferruginibacter lapsinanis TaxID=563172 RepID=UPI001E341825|nr:YtxH domain-containing protein [Ferruginibacter lapsinanis]UEG49216.1 YtxH domain-containing protein [Ferruginibacter lapsinanis]